MAYGIHKIRIINPTTGAQRREFGSYKKLAYTRQVNAPGGVTLELRANHPAVSVIQADDLIVVYRRWPDTSWRIEQVGVAQDPTYETDDAGLTNVRWQCPGVMNKLADRVVAWYAKTKNRSRFLSAKAETIMKTLVTYNAGSSATTANGRRVGGVMTGLAVQADAAGGNTISEWACAYDNLLDTLQQLARIAGGDFDLIYAPGPSYTFNFYAGQRGTNRVGSLTFSPERKNMARATLAITRSTNRTIAIVGGQGTDSKRKVVSRTASTYNATTNHRELFVDANNAKSNELNGLGDAALVEARPTMDFSFEIRQTANCRYAVHYDLGDWASFQRPDGAIQSLKIVGVTITSQDGKEEITPEVSDA